ncbi:heparan-alpha-glucosaminide N-acetyltransferase-like [Daphnia carinata]|uniref:heparan-alpha-glucosaminide N-acetyltransferase-like n=1 Tax=Daphnia carinata TaxID=120202 RepID=UPI00257CE767|nr:heparan-alpha-glucosaminide N-acetyltransferase-like [Daphnia carinata]
MNWAPEIPEWCNSTKKQYLLKMDQACFTLHHISKHTKEDIELWGQSSKCQECPMWKFALIKPASTAVVVVNTTYPTLFQVKRNELTVCNFSFQFGEFGQYSMNASHDECSGIELNTLPANIYLPLLWASVAIFLVLFIWGLKCVMQDQYISCHLSNWLPGSSTAEASLLITETSAQQANPIRYRIRCLDTFRGLTIILMIIVNYGGGGYWFFEHSPWNGITIADVIFPCFVWILGASCVLSLNSQLRRALSKQRIVFGVVRRSVAMLVIGLVLNSLNNNNVKTFRIPGVLQRLSFVYLIVALIELIGFDPEDNHRYAWFASIRDIVCSWRQWIIVNVLVTTQLLITFLLPVPGCPLGYMGAGGLEKNGLYKNCTGGAARYVDIALFGNDHIYQRPTPRAIYDTTLAFDPEGMLGGLTCVLTAYLGAEAAKVLLAFPANKQRIIRWLLWSLLTGLTGGLLCAFRIDDGPIPINKNLWSLSFALVTSSIAFCVLTILYVFIDVLSWWSGAPFRYAGMNALLLYIGHVFARPLLPFSWQPLASTHAAHLSMNLTAAAVWILIAFVLYRKRLFFTL